MEDYEDQDIQIELPRDEDGHIVGYSIGGTRGYGIEEWLREKEEREFELLCARLKGRKYAAERRAADPEAARKRCRDWRAENHEQHRRLENGRRAKKSAARRHLACLCKQCGRAFTPERFIVGTKWCSKKCSNLWHGPRRRTRNRGILNMHTGADLVYLLRTYPWSTTRELFDLMPKRSIPPKFPSVASLISLWRKQGKVIDDGKKRGRRYALKGES